MREEREVRVLNGEGLFRFRDYLASLRKGSREGPPWGLLEDGALSSPLEAGAVVEPREFAGRMEAARYLREVLDPVPAGQVRENAGLWSWLSLLYFDQVCPARADGTRSPGKDYRHVLSADSIYRLRHLLFGAWTALEIHGERAAFLLSSPLHQESKFHRELAARQGLFANRGLVEAAGLLYFDEEKGTPRRGAATTQPAPGNLRRFVAVAGQLDLTWDLFSMSGPEILELLPSEFDRWK